MIEDDVLPTYDVSDAVAVVVKADAPIGSGAHVLASGLLDVAREAAEVRGKA